MYRIYAKHFAPVANQLKLAYIELKFYTYGIRCTIIHPLVFVKSNQENGD